MLISPLRFFKIFRQNNKKSAIFMNKWPSKKIFESDKKSKNLISVRTVLELGALGLHF